MQYQGGKSKFGKSIVEFIKPYRRDSQFYVEPFLGGGSIMSMMTGNRIGNDNHPYLINMWIALQNGWIPPSDVSEELYNTIKENKENYPKELVAFVGHACAYGGQFFRGYARGRGNYALSGKNTLLSKIDKMRDCIFYNMSYNELELPKHSLIYCDPPYANTKGYRNNSFDHALFWEWVRQKCIEGHTVFVSEYNAPSDFEAVLEIERTSHMDKQSYNKIYKEKLFCWKDMV